jgi:predicted Zn-dependent peptidase
MRGAGSMDSRALADAFDRAGATRSIDASGRGMNLRSTVIGDDIGAALGLLSMTVLSPRLEGESLEPARLLSLQALESLNDEPRERASIAARARQYPEPFNRSSYGDRHGLEAVALEDVRGWWSRHARPGGSVIGVAGAVDASRVADTLERLLEGWSGQGEDPQPQSSPSFGPGHLSDESSQVQIIVLRQAPSARDRHAALREQIAADVLSGGMSGRLFTEVREKRGLCYAVNAGYRGDDRFGVLSAYVGTTPERAQQSLDVLLAELDRIGTPQGAVTRGEFDRAVVGMTSNLVFHGESTAGRAGALVSDQLRLGRARSLEEMTAEAGSVTLDSLNEYLGQRPAGGTTIQTLGPRALEMPAGI